MMKKTVALIVSLILAACLLIIPVCAASASAAVSVSSSTVKPNAQFTVTVKVSSNAKLGSVEGLMSYDASKVDFISGNSVSGAAGKLKFSQWSADGGSTEFKFTLTFKAKAEGSSAFSFETTEISDADFSPVGNVSASSTVKIEADKPLSSNNNLSSLKLSSGTLAPAFSKNVTSYTVNVPNTTTTVRLTCTAEDANAKTTVTGSSDLKVGTNTRTVTVTAQNGSKKNYTIKIIRAAAEGQSLPSEEPASSAPESTEEPENVTVYIDGAAMTVVEDFKNDLIPEGFKPTVATVNGRDVMAVTNADASITMLCLKDDTGADRFFIYDEKNINYYPYLPLTLLGRKYIPMPKPDSVTVPKGFSQAAVTIGEKEYPAWICDENNEFYLMYLYNDKGETMFYLYDSVEGTAQRYIGGLPAGSKKTNTSTKPIIEKTDSLFGRIGVPVAALLGAAVIALSVLMIVFLAGNGKKRSAKAKDNYDGDFVLPKK